MSDHMSGREMLLEDGADLFEVGRLDQVAVEAGGDHGGTRGLVVPAGQRQQEDVVARGVRRKAVATS